MLALLAALAPPCAMGAAPKPANQAPGFAAVGRQVDDAVATRIVPSIAIAAVERGRIVWMHASGWADIAAKRRATADTVYRVGSVSKSLTATVAAIAKGDGRIDPGQPLSRYLAAYPPTTRLGAAHLQDLLDMNAGLVQAVHYRGFPGDFSDLGNDRFVAEYAVAPLASRTRYAYSNMGPELVARAIGAELQQPFAQFERERLFKPLHMTHTDCGPEAARTKGLATGYWSNLTPIADAYEIDPPAGAGCVSSLRDLAAYANFHLSTMRQGSSPLGPVALARLHTPREDRDYGNGWGRIGNGELAQLISDGQVNGGEAVVLLAHAQRAGVVVLTNTANDIVYRLAQAALEVIVPGTSAEFDHAAVRLQAEHDRKFDADYPPPRPWRARGAVVAGGVRKAVDIDVSETGIDIRYDNGAPEHGKPIERDDGFARWEIPCADFLPACRQGQNAVARLQLARDGAGYAGAISVDSRLGLFPYEVHFEAAP